MASSDTSSRSWDLGQFVKTLSYFGAIPFLSSVDWFQAMMGSRPDPKADGSAIALYRPVVLVIGADASPIGQTIVQKLLDAGNRVRVVVANQSTFSTTDFSATEQMENLETVVSAPGALPERVWQQVHRVIGCDATGTAVTPWLSPALVETVQHHLIPGGDPIFDFSQPTLDLQETWGALDDVVMGGVSASNIRLTKGFARFSGNVSTTNSGGFASVRTRNFSPAINLSGYEGIVLKVQGDGQRYKCLLRCEDRWDGLAYSYSFDTTPGEWLDVYIPFADLIPVFRARTVKDAGAFDQQTLRAIQLMLSKFEYDGALNPAFNPGDFQLDIAAIAAYRASPDPQVILLTTDQSVIETMRQTSLPHQILDPSAVRDGSYQFSI
jgi:hypothetical protein